MSLYVSDLIGVGVLMDCITMLPSVSSDEQRGTSMEVQVSDQSSLACGIAVKLALISRLRILLVMVIYKW